jgi:hypothetical protein
MDVADILGLKRSSSSAQDDAAKILGEKSKSIGSKSKSKPKGMSRELFALMGTDGIAPSIQTTQGNLYKDKRQHSFQGKWVWAPFSNSARRFIDSFYVIFHLYIFHIAIISSAIIGSKLNYKDLITLTPNLISKLSQ